MTDIKPSDDTGLDAGLANVFSRLTYSSNQSIVYFASEMAEIVQASAKSTSPSPLWHCIYIKAWLEKTAETNITADRPSFNESEDDQDEDIPMMNFNSKKKDPAYATKRRRLNSLDKQDLEALNRSILKALRRGQLDRVIELSSGYDDWRKLLFKTYVDAVTSAQDGSPIPWNTEKRKAWRNMCSEQLKDESLGPFGKAVFSVLGGKVEHALPVCETWEDIIWSYNNACLQDAIDKFLCSLSDYENITVSTQSEDLAYLHPSVATMAIYKDTLLAKQVLHQITDNSQSAFLSNKPLKLVQYLHDICVDGHWNKLGDYCETPHLQAVFFRLAVALVLYIQTCLKIEDPKISSLLATYATSISKESFNNMAIYASALPGPLQQKVVSEFFKGFNGDKNECIKLVRIAKRYKLDITSILECTYVLYMKEFASKQNIPQFGPQDSSFEVEGALSDTSRLCLKALSWLTLEDGLPGTIIERVNGVLRYMFATRQIYLANVVANSVPNSYINRCILYTKGSSEVPDSLTEFYNHTTAIGVLKMHQTWKMLRDNQPKDTGSLEALDAVQTWETEFRSLTIRLSENIRTLLESEWLRSTWSEEEALEYMDWTSTELIPWSNAELRRIYVPELVIYLHDAYYDTRNLFTEHAKKSLDLINFVSQQDTEIYKDIAAAKKTGLLLQYFCKSQFTLL
ncbi:nuclear pore protein 84/107 [Phycomyces nitens]|nr:nuclear pore protein 84/107 [Phycomyces nitens]